MTKCSIPAALRRLLAAAALLLGTGAPPAVAQADAPALPLWEAGLGAVARTSAAYPASARQTQGVAPRVLFIYRGEVVEVGGDATLRVIPFRTDRLQFGITVDGSSAVDAQDNALRGALPDPDLEALAEFGPEVVFRGLQRPALFGDGTGRYDITLQTRGVFSVALDSVTYRGLLVRPTVRYLQRDSLAPGARILASAGPVFATEGVHDFFYQTGGYDARGGYLGTELALSLRHPLRPGLSAIGGVGISLHAGAANRGSPRFERPVNGSAFLGLTYTFLQSRRAAAR